MTEDPGDGYGERVVTHSSACPEHPEYDDLLAEREAEIAVHVENEARLDAESARRAADHHERAARVHFSFGESMETDRDTWRAQAEYVLGHHSYRDEAGVSYRTVLDRRGNRRWLVMDDAQAQELTAAVPERFGAAPRHMLATLVPNSDMARFRSVDDPRPTRPRYNAVPSTEGLSASARARIGKDLNRSWRQPDGTVRTLAEVITSDGMTGKSVTVHNGVRKYFLTLHADDRVGGSGAYTPWPVSKETWTAFGAPDIRTPRDRASERLAIASHRLIQAENALQTSRALGHRYTELLRRKDQAEKAYVEAQDAFDATSAS